MGSKVVRARLDEASESALRVLVSEGRSESEAVRAALVEAGQRRGRRAALVEEARALNVDPHDVQVRRELLADFDAVSSDWPQ